MDRRLEGHQVTLFSNRGKPMRSNKPDKPEGMSARKWKKIYKAARRKANADTGATSQVQ